MTLIGFLAALVLMSPCSLPANAGILAINTQTAVKTDADKFLGTIKVCNTGDVDAYDVQVTVIVSEEQIKSPLKKLLAPNEPDTFSVEKTLAGLKKGRYPVTVIVDFHDANQHPFSAVSCTTFSFKEDVNADLVCVVDDLAMGKKGQLRVSLRNPGPGPRNCRATLVLPRELSSQKHSIDLEIAAGSEKTVAFEIENLSALSGSAYPVFCSVEYDLGDTHYAAVSGAVVRISQKQNWFYQTRWLWAAAGSLFGGIFVLCRIKRDKSQYVGQARL